MADIVIERSHELGLEKAREMMVGMEANLKERYGVTFAWSGDHANIKGKGVSGTLRLSDANVVVELKLGLLAKPFATKIRESMERKFDRALA